MTNTAQLNRTSMFLFPRDSHLTGMLSWMGDDYPVALAGVLAKGFQNQQPGTRLVSIRCLKQPELVTSFFTGTLNKRIRAIFMVEALLVDPLNKVWRLEIRATCTGRMLSRPEDGILASDVKVINIERFITGGDALLASLAKGVECARCGKKLRWNANLAELLACGSPRAETEEGTHYLSWENETILGGLDGLVFTSLSPGQAGLNYISVSPTQADFSGEPDDGLLPEWEFLTRQFGPPDERRPGYGFRWVRGPLEFLLLFQKRGEQTGENEFQKWVTIRWLGNGTTA